MNPSTRMDRVRNIPVKNKECSRIAVNELDIFNKMLGDTQSPQNIEKGFERHRVKCLPEVDKGSGERIISGLGCMENGLKFLDDTGNSVLQLEPELKWRKI